MEVANKLKRLSLDINTVGLYDEAEEEKDGIKKSCKKQC